MSTITEAFTPDAAHRPLVRAMPLQRLRRDGRTLDADARGAIHAAFTANPCLKSWPAHAIDALCDAGQLRTWTNGELIFARDEPCDDIQVVLSGAIEMSWTNSAGVRAVAVYMRPNEVINFIPVLDRRGSMHDQRAHGSTTLFHIPGKALFDLFAREPALLRNVLDLICLRSRALHGRLGRTALAGFRARMAEQLLALAEWHGRPTGQGVELTIRLSQEDLAALLAASRQSINKELRWLVRNGIVDVRYSRLTVIDMKALRELSEAA
ncbi:cAMP-binding protein [Burkholderia sp. Ch1-1]|uniref:cAMP-binding protein n=1 Tax=Paraburkholderia dioscoreae TaxID=2604047 RepID=A0A5Q4Z6S5_9BURK|nr:MULTISPECIES: Crp/Fnr family transcriptional regulator [Paraburkholderia]EIF31066.1 cAMP-binding protein [Burkholderia sp. Ch1-1]MDR8402271.1 Crp/Fnr family transcriptional regulator [Paraburkholderia sp. USG1]VVD28743.1 cAMP-binding protein [Paraburkholderia dioscoreae]